MNFNDLVQQMETEPSAIREKLGDNGAEKVNAILAILAIGGTRIEYARAVLAAAEMALDKTIAVKFEKEKD